MDIGTGIAVAGIGFSVVGIVYRIIPTRNEEHCPDHSGICKSIEALTAWLAKIELKLDRVIERGN